MTDLQGHSTVVFNEVDLIELKPDTAQMFFSICWYRGIMYVFVQRRTETTVTAALCQRMNTVESDITDITECRLGSFLPKISIYFGMQIEVISVFHWCVTHRKKLKKSSIPGNLLGSVNLESNPKK